MLPSELITLTVAPDLPKALASESDCGVEQERSNATWILWRSTSFAVETGYNRAEDKEKRTFMFKVRSSVLFLVLAGIIPADAQTYTVLHNFATNSTDGVAPYGSLVEDTTGNLYGATFLGPATNGIASSLGTIFKFAPPGTLTTLYTFTSYASGGPFAPGVTLGADGNLYGVTGYGGTGGPSHACANSEGVSGCGTIFKLTPGGIYSVLYNFDDTHGAFPQNPLTLGSDGNFYGSTPGVIFRITAQGDYSVLHYLDSADGTNPGPLLQAMNGSFYGTTTAGGTNNAGTIFNITTAGQFTVVYNFAAPYGGPYSLVQGEDGNLYGTLSGPLDNVQSGPAYSCVAVCGTVFKMTPQGSFSVLYDFPVVSAITQGAQPYALFQGPSDNFFGLAGGGKNIPGCVGAGTTGSYCGIMFQVTAAGAYSIVYDFDYAHGDMAWPPTRGSDGNYYGTTFQGGPPGSSGTSCFATGCGVIYAEVMNDFSIAASALQPGTISPGASSTSAVNVAAVGAFSTSVGLACSVQPTTAIAPSCSISPSSVTPGTVGTLTVSTTAPSMAGLPSGGRSRPFYGFWLPLAGLAVALVDLGSDRSEKQRMAALLLLVAVLLGLVFTVSCGGDSTTNTGGTGSSEGTPAGTYTITVTGTSGFLQHSTTTTLTVH